MRRFGQDRRDVSEDREHRRRTDRGQSERDQHLAALQHAEFGEHIAARIAADVGKRKAQRRHRDQAPDGDRAKGGAPAERLADPGRERHPDDIGERQPHEHRRDRARTLFRRDKTRRDYRTDAEKGAVVERGDDARDHQRRVIARDGGKEIAEREDRHQPDQQGAAVHPRGGERHQRRAEHHAERIGRNEQPGGRDRNPQPFGHVGEQPHRGKFGDADTEGTGRERKEGKVDFHVGCSDQTSGGLRRAKPACCR